MALGTLVVEKESMVATFGSLYHYMGVVFVGLLILQNVLTAMGLRREKPYQQQDAEAVDLPPWPYAKPVGAALAIFVIAVYVFFAG